MLALIKHIDVYYKIMQNKIASKHLNGYYIVYTAIKCCSIIINNMYNECLSTLMNILNYNVFDFHKF